MSEFMIACLCLGRELAPSRRRAKRAIGDELADSSFAAGLEALHARRENSGSSIGERDLGVLRGKPATGRVMVRN
jgi:hypothetical protein